MNYFQIPCLRCKFKIKLTAVSMAIRIKGRKVLWGNGSSNGAGFLMEVKFKIMSL